MEVKEVWLDFEDPDIRVLLGADLDQYLDKDLTKFLKDINQPFHGNNEDMNSIFKDRINDKLNIDPSFRSMHQKIRKFAPERNMIIQE